MNEYMAIFRESFAKYAPEIKAAARAEWLEQNMRFDGAQQTEGRNSRPKP